MTDRLLMVIMRRCFATAAVWAVVAGYGALHGAPKPHPIIPSHWSIVQLCDGQNTVYNC